MDTQIVAIYCICDDILKGLQHCEDKQRQMSDAEIMTTSIVAGLFFGGNIEKSRISACDNYRISRCHLYHGEDWRGYQASKKRYYYGLKIHLMVTQQGQPVEFFLTPGSWSDTRALKMYRFDLPDGSLITGDKAYTDYAFEDLLEEAQMELQPLRKKNSKRPVPAWITYMLACYRKVIETTGSLLEQLLPKHIHAVTARGFELKVAIFVLATSFNFLKVAT